MKKILVAGNWRAFIHEESISLAFEKLGCKVIRFQWNKYFTKNPFFSLYAKLEYRLSFGFIVAKINRDLVHAVVTNSPEILFIYRPILISKKTLIKIKKESPITVIISYNNDDPFSSKYSMYSWLRYKKSIPYYDVIYSYRPSNIDQYIMSGAKVVKLLPPWFIKEKNFPIKLKPNEIIKYQSDVVFVGHYEADGRADIIKSIIKSGLKISLYGPGWNSIVINDNVLKSLYPVRYLSGNEYNKVLCGAKIALAFYSSLNNDVYTRKCFEIPATSTMMIAKRTKEMQEFFKEDKECIYFDNTSELIEKIDFYLKNDKLRKMVAKKGYQRVMNSRHDVIGRAEYILDSYNQI